MSKKTVRVTVPRNKPNDFLKLLNKIKEKHLELGVSSPLNNHAKLDMTNFELKLQQASQLYEEAVQLHKTAESKMYEARGLMGFAHGQTSRTDGTLYNDTTLIISILKTVFMGNEESMSEYGLNVVIGQARLPKRSKG